MLLTKSSWPFIFQAQGGMVLLGLPKFEWGHATNSGLRNMGISNLSHF